MYNLTQLPGTLLADLDTPCLFVDLDIAEENFNHIASVFSETECKMRQHIKNVKSPVVANMQIKAGGTVNGICSAKVSEAEVMVQGGITDVLIANQVVSKEKISRMCALAKNADIKVCVDNHHNLHDLSSEASKQCVSIGVLIEVDTSMGRAGVRNVSEAVALATIAVDLPGIEFKGVMSHQGISGVPDSVTRKRKAQDYIQQCLEAKDAIESAGIDVEVVSSGETWSYDVAGSMPGVTEVEGGTYALMGTRSGYMNEFKIANKILATIISKPSPGKAVADIGLRALPVREGALPAIDESITGVEVESILEEHIVLNTEAAPDIELGDKIVLLPWDQDTLVNRCDYFVLVRGGVVVNVLPIPGRGCFH